MEDSPFVDLDTGAISDGFVELNNRRESADYDHEAVFTRADTRANIGLARSVVKTIGRADSAEAQCFFGLIALQGRIQNR